MSEMHLPRMWDIVGEILLYHCGEWGGKIQPHSHNHNSHLKKYQNVRKSGQLWDLRGYFSCIWENAGRCGKMWELFHPHFPTFPRKHNPHKVGKNPKWERNTGFDHILR